MGKLSDHLVRNYTRNHVRIIELAGRVPEADFARSIGPSLHSIAYQVWHVARWTDLFAWSLAENDAVLRAAGYPGGHLSVELWVAEDLARRWGLPAGALGRRDSGTSMDDADADRLAWPRRAELVDYAGRAFELGQRVVAAVPEAALLEPAPGDPDGDSYAENILIYSEHDSRHLGMMEAIIGLQGGRGSATR
jgi:hypothetical protein